MEKHPAISELIDQICLAQSDGSGSFDAGLFASWRENHAFGYSRPDQNIFCSLSIAFILQSLEGHLGVQEKEKCSEICHRVLSILPKFESAKGKDTYNFWKTRPSRHFPSGFFMHRFRYFQLPDDVDDTALAFLVKNETEGQISELKEKLKRHCDPSKRVYDTWFGLNMPKESDFCALCNLMCLLLQSKQPLNAYDLATLNFINNSIVSKEFVIKPFWLSRNYGSTALIVYHFARLWALCKPTSLSAAKDTLLAMQAKLLGEVQTDWERLLCQIAYLKLGAKPKPLHYNLKGLWQEKPYFFVASLFAPLGKRWSDKLAEKEWTWLGWNCPALTLALMVEHKVWLERFCQNEKPLPAR